MTTKRRDPESIDASELQAAYRELGGVNLNEAAKAVLAKREAAQVRQLSGKTGELDGALEEQVVSEIVTSLRLAGYRLPSEWKPGCVGIFMRVGQRRADKAGTDKGMADMVIVRLSDMKIWLVEVKARTKDHDVRKEQELLAQIGVITIVDNAPDVLRLIEN